MSDSIKITNEGDRSVPVTVDGKVVEVPANTTIEVARLDVITISNPGETDFAFLNSDGSKRILVKARSSIDVPRAVLAPRVRPAERRPWGKTDEGETTAAAFPAPGFFDEEK